MLLRARSGCDIAPRQGQFPELGANLESSCARARSKQEISGRFGGRVSCREAFTAARSSSLKSQPSTNLGTRRLALLYSKVKCCRERYPICGKASIIVGLLMGVSLLIANSAPSLAGLFVYGVVWTPSNNVSPQIPGGYVVKDASGQALAYVYARC